MTRKFNPSWVLCSTEVHYWKDRAHQIAALKAQHDAIKARLEWLIASQHPEFMPKGMGKGRKSKAKQVVGIRRSA